MKNYIAHSQNAEGEKQDLKDHNRKVADLMKTHALSKEYEELYAYCGQIHDMTLKDRTMICSCGNKMDRDINAAINIKNAGMNTILAESICCTR